MLKLPCLSNIKIPNMSLTSFWIHLFFFEFLKVHYQFFPRNTKYELSYIIHLKLTLDKCVICKKSDVQYIKSYS